MASPNPASNVDENVADNSHKKRVPEVSNLIRPVPTLKYNSLAAARRGASHRYMDEAGAKAASDIPDDIPRTQAQKNPYILRLMIAILRLNHPDMIDKAACKKSRKWRVPGEEEQEEEGGVWKASTAVQEMIDDMYTMEEIELVAREIVVSSQSSASCSKLTVPKGSLLCSIQRSLVGTRGPSLRQPKGRLRDSEDLQGSLRQD